MSATGVVTPGLSLARPWKSPNAMASVMTGDGITVAFETGQPKPISITDVPDAMPASVVPRAVAASRTTADSKGEIPQVSVATITASGETTTQLISDPLRWAVLDTIATRGATTVVKFRQKAGQPWLTDWVAVRPAGSSAFLPAVSLASRSRDKFGNDEVFLGADGSGVVLSVPSDRKAVVFARRISKSGAVGPPIPFGTRSSAYAVGKAAVGPNGDVVVAVVDPTHGVDGLFVASLPAGAASFTTPRLVGRERSTSEQIAEGLAIAIDDAGHVTVVTGREFKEDSDEVDQGLQTYAGTGDRLVRGPFVPAVVTLDPVMLTPTVDGGIALTWPGHVIGTEKIAQFIAFGRPDGSWSVPEAISPPFRWEVASYVNNRGITALPGGGIAMAYDIERSGHPTRCSLARVAP